MLVILVCGIYQVCVREWLNVEVLLSVEAVCVAIQFSAMFLVEMADGYRVVVHVCIFNTQDHLLIQQRASAKLIWPSLWGVSVGGGVDAGEISR